MRFLPFVIPAVTATLATPSLADAPDGYRLVWADEFDDNGPPNPANWQFERGFVRNEERQWYQADNAVCRDGLLVLEGRRERVPNPRYDARSDDWAQRREFAEYTSASLNTRGRFEWQYGMLEVRAKIDARAGLWPAIWTLGRRGGWPSNGEVDVMEYYDDSILANACWAARRHQQPTWDTCKVPLDRFGANWADQFHVWRMWWNENEILLTVDDQLLNAIDLGEVDRDVGVERNPFRQPHYLLLNLAIGGVNGGDPSNTAFPSQYLVDYARVYQLIKGDRD